MKKILLFLLMCPCLARSQPVHLGLSKDSVDILFPMSEKTDKSDDRRTYFDLIVDDVNWNGINGRLYLKFDSVNNVKGFHWVADIKPKQARNFVQSLQKQFGKPAGDKSLPKNEKDMLSWHWDKNPDNPAASYMFGSVSFFEGQISNGKLFSPNDINANYK